MLNSTFHQKELCTQIFLKIHRWFFLVCAKDARTEAIVYKKKRWGYSWLTVVVPAAAAEVGSAQQVGRHWFRQLGTEPVQHRHHSLRPRPGRSRTHWLTTARLLEISNSSLLSHPASWYLTRFGLKQQQQEVYYQLDTLAVGGRSSRTLGVTASRRLWDQEGNRLGERYQ